jgi:hypothetical protein
MGNTIVAWNDGAKIIMLARNNELKDQKLQTKTEEQIRMAFEQGAEFIVGDQPGVDSPFINYLKKIGAKFTMYYGDNQRINLELPTREVIVPAKTEAQVVAPYVKPSFDMFKQEMFQVLVSVKDSKFSWRITSSLTQAQREGAVADINKGKLTTKRAATLLTELQGMYDKGMINLNMGRGNQATAMDISIEDYFKKLISEDTSQPISEENDNPTKSNTVRIGSKDVDIDNCNT